MKRKWLVRVDRPIIRDKKIWVEPGQYELIRHIDNKRVLINLATMPPRLLTIVNFSDVFFVPAQPEGAIHENQESY